MVYYDYIEEKLHVLAYRTETKGKLNILDLHMHSENFYLHFFNLIYGLSLENINQFIPNAPAIDLIDHTNKIVIQVSSTNSKAKIEGALKKSIIKRYSSYTFKFISIAKNASTLKDISYNNPHSIAFNPSSDIYDIATILSDIHEKPASEMYNIFEFIKNELGGEVDIVKLDSNLAAIINILADEEWDDAGTQIDPLMEFEIERKIAFNKLDVARSVIEDFKIYNTKVSAKYAQFDDMGKNKSNSVLHAMKSVYQKNKNDKKSDEIFYAVSNEMKSKVMDSLNYDELPIDELELCIDILVVDAFIRCKILENPEGYKYVAS